MQDALILHRVDTTRGQVGGRSGLLRSYRGQLGSHREVEFRNEGEDPTTVRTEVSPLRR